MIAKELRIGNLVRFEQTADVVRRGWYIGEVSNIDGDSRTIQIKDFIIKSNFTLATKIEAIELTPEILTDWCGFEISTTRAEIRIDFWKVIREENPYRSIGLDIDVNGLIRCYLLESYDEDIEDNRSDWYHLNDNHIKYLHQLQNLIFALTGSELEIKIPQKA